VQQTRRIEWTQTAGEFGALLLENRQIKDLQPIHNRRQRKKRQLWTLQPHPVDAGNRLTVIARALNAEPDAHPLHGLFPSKAAALRQLKRLTRQHALCEQTLGLQPGQGRCYAHQLGRCRGACCGEESLQDHNRRLLTALGQHHLSAWPWPGPIVIEEPGLDQPMACDWHLIDRWAYLGTARQLNELDALQQQSVPNAFDLDAYFIVQKALKSAELTVYLAHNQPLQAIPMPERLQPAIARRRR
jgi:DNA polymerase-3 subunit epsilon